VTPTPEPILAQLRDAADQRGWVRGLGLDTLVQRSGRTADEVRRAMVTFRDGGMIRYQAREGSLVGAIRITKETRKIPTIQADRLEREALNGHPAGEGPHALLVDDSPLIAHAAAKRRANEIKPGDIVVSEGRVPPVPPEWREAYPAIAELIDREAEILEAAEAFERHGMKDLADMGLARLSSQTPLERDVLKLVASIGLKAD